MYGCTDYGVDIVENLQISIKIKEICKNKKISISSVLDACSLSKSFIYDLEKRNASPSVDKIFSIAEYLDVSVDYLLGRTDDPSAHKK